MQADRPDVAEGERRRWRALGAAGAAAVLAHVALFDALEAPRWRSAVPAAPVPAPAPAPALEVRAVAVTPPGPAPVEFLVKPDDRHLASALPVAAASTQASATKAPSRGSAVIAVRDIAAKLEQRDASPPLRLSGVATEPPPSEPSVADAGAALPAAAAEPPDDPPVPVYSAQPPPPATLQYRLQRGAALGRAELNWQPAEGGYVVRLEARLAGRAVLTQTSQGELGPGGLAPLRFTDRRGRREEAVNFQRDAGKITFSGPKAVLPIWPGGQDALSWMLQVAAIVGADPAVRAPGASVALHVVGGRADDAVWVFRGTGPEVVDTADGPVAADRFVREPRGAYDLRAEVWLDPLRHHLPVRIVLTVGADADSLDFVLESMTTP